MDDFVTSCICHLENSSWALWIFQMLAHFITQYQKITFANIATNLIRILCVLGSCQTNSGYRFSKILIFTWKVEFYCQLFSWKLQNYLAHFQKKKKKKSAKFSSLENHSLSSSCSFKERWGFILKKRLVQHAIQIITCAFPQDNHCISGCSRGT